MEVNMLIAGEHRSAASGKTFDRIDPYTGNVASRAAGGGVEDALAAVAAAQAAFPVWSAKGPQERRKYLLKAAQIMEARSQEFIDAMVAETGCTVPWAGFNVAVGVKVLIEAASMTTQIAGEAIPADKAGTLSLAIRQPAGVCLGIAPWNAAVILGTRAIAMALSCGNTAILKASEMCPATHRLIGEVLQEAGLPAGTVNVVTNAPEDAAAVVEALIDAPAVRRVNFTGSTTIGRRIAVLCAQRLKPVLLELGGKAPFIVLDDADLDAAVNAAAFGAFLNQGQICMSTERLIVHEAIADQFVERLAAKTRNLPAGDPRGQVVLGALITREAAEKMDGIIADAVALGAKVVVGGKRDGAVVEATLLDHVTPQMRVYTEESFGPVKPIIRVRDAEEAIKVANDTEYGLSAALFTRDVHKALQLVARIESGICHINGPTVADEPQMPFGGVKNSGYGRFGGKAAIAEFTDLRWITIEDPRQGYPF